MGNTYTVQVWGQHLSVEYSYMTWWQGKSLLRALLELVKAKRQGYRCVKLEWR